MASSEKRKSKSTRHEVCNSFASLTEEQRLKRQQTSGQSDNKYLAGTSFYNSPGQSQPVDSEMSPLSSRSTDPDGDNAIAFYPSEGNTPETDRPTLVDAVIEQLRQARMRRQRPH